MTQNIRKEFKRMINENDWMDTESKKAAQEKVVRKNLNHDTHIK